METDHSEELISIAEAETKTSAVAEEFTQVEEELVDQSVPVVEPSVTLPTSDEKAGEPSEPSETEAVSEVNPRSSDTQSSAGATAGRRASLMNCCGLLDVLRPSSQ